jgi:hypothetical protein
MLEIFSTKIYCRIIFESQHQDESNEEEEEEEEEEGMHVPSAVFHQMPRKVMKSSRQHEQTTLGKDYHRGSTHQTGTAKIPNFPL